MRDIKSDFREWLQNNFSKSTASDYYSLLQKIFYKNFGDNQNWQEHSNNIMPLMIQYFEFANRQYYLDRVTIWYALNYFSQISNFIKQGNLKNQIADVDIYIFDGNKDYFAVSTKLYHLYEDVLTIQCYLFGNSNNSEVKSDNLDIFKLSMLLIDIQENSTLKDLKDAAIHIVYKNKNNSREKTALSQYCDFLYSLTEDQNFLYPSNEFIKLIENKNPNKTIKGNYKIVQHLTGNNPLKVGIKETAIIYYHNYNPDCNFGEDTQPTDFILVKEDLAEIFNLDIKTIKKYFIKKDAIDKMLVDPEKIAKLWKRDKTIITTVIRNYFSIKATNTFLSKGHKPLVVKHETVDYDCEGYEYWLTRLEATKFLNISHNAFHYLIDGSNCSRIEYILGCVRYYAPDIEYLKSTFPFKRALRRRIKYIKNK